MADNLDTLSIGTIRLRKEYPIAQAQANRVPDAANDEHAAAAARARIAALPDYMPLPTYHPAIGDLTMGPAAAAVPTAELVVDKTKLAAAARATPHVRRRRIPSVLLPFLTAAGVFLLVLLLFKAPVIISQIQYSLSNKPSTPAVATAPTTEIVPAANTISIPKINVQAPVNYEPSIQEAAIQTALETGVVHYGNTAAPGTPGNVAIFGHSSNDWWEPGNYKFVFVLLDKLSPGDQVTLDYQSHRYVYQVTSSTVVDPTDVAVLNPTATPTLTLITCSPPGTSLRRLIVTAKQISPSPGKTAVTLATPAAQSPKALASSSNGFFDQVGAAWNGIFNGVSSLFGGSSKTPSPSPAAGTTSGQLPAAN